MSILKSTNSGRHCKLTMSYLLEHGWKTTDIIGHVIYRTQEEKLHQTMDGQFLFYLREKYVFEEKTYILLVKSIHDLDLVLEYYNVVKRSVDEKMQLEALMQTVSFSRTLGASEYEVHQRYNYLLKQLEDKERFLVGKMEEKLHKELELVKEVDEDLENPERFSHII